MANLLQKASIVLTPTAYDNGKVLCAKPSEPPYGDFDFSRNSAATRVNAQGLVENVQILSSNLVQNGDFSEEGVQEISNGSFSQEGIELTTNGDFSNGITEWTTSGGNPATVLNGTATVPSGSYIFQSGGIPASTQVKLVVEGTGKIRYRLGTAEGYSGQIDMPFTLYVPTQSLSARVQLQNSSGGDVTITNVSLKEVGQDWDLGTGWSIGEDKVIYDGSGYSGIGQIIPNLIGKIFKVQFDIIDYTSGTIRISPSNKESGSDIRYSNNGTYVEYYTSAQNRLDLQPQLFNGSVTNISVKEVGQNWNINNDGAGATTNITLGALNIITDGTFTNAQQNGFLTSGNNYSLTYTIISNAVVGVLQATIGTAVVSVTVPSTVGTHSIEFTAAGSAAFAFKRGGGPLDVSITNISIIEITDDTNLPRINYEGFSYQDALGSELVTNGDFSNGSANWSVSGANATHIATFDGSSLRYQSDTTSPQLLIIQGGVLVIGKTYKIVVDIKTLTSGAIKSDTLGGLVITSNQGINTFYAIATGTSFTFTRATANVDITIDNISIKEYLGQSVVPGSGCGSWLFEPQSTNLITYSEEMSQYGSNVTVIDNSTKSPNGNIDASKVTKNGVSANDRIDITNIALLNNTNYSISAFIKNVNIDNGGVTTLGVRISSGGTLFRQGYVWNGDTPSLTVDYNSGTKTNVLLEDYGNGWWRIGYSFNSDGTNSDIEIDIDRDNGTDTTSVFIWGAQVEQQSYSTSYIPTSGSTVTRNQDLCNNGGSLASINSTEGTLYFEGSALANDGTFRLLGFSDGTTTNRVYIGYSSANNITCSFQVSSSVVYSFNKTADINVNSKIALKYKENDFALWVNGVKVNSQSSGNTFPIGTLTQMQFTSATTSSTFFGKTKALAVWKEALSDAELADLTYPTPTDPTFALDFDTIATDFTFARGSEATYVDAQGLIQSTNELGPEEITNGDFSTDGIPSTTSWSLGWYSQTSNVLISGGKLTLTNSASQSTALAYATDGVSSLNVVTVNKTYKLQYRVIENNGVTSFKYYSAGGSFIVAPTDLGVTHTIYIKNTANQIFLFQNATTNSSISIDNVSIKEYKTETNTPRIDYSTGTEAFLLEPQSTNLVPYSEDFEVWNQIQNVNLISNSTISPSGENNATKFLSTTGNSKVRNNFSVVSGTTYTFSVYCKNIDATFVRLLAYDGANEFSLNVVSQINTSTWTKVSLTFTATNTSGSGQVQIARDLPDGESLYFWGAQLEQQSYATSYIPTSGTTVTRNQETCINATPEINSEEGVLYAEIAKRQEDNDNFILISLNNAASNSDANSVTIGFSNDTDFYSRVRANAVNVMTDTTVATNANQFYKVALKYKSGNISVFIDGVNVVSNTTAFSFGAVLDNLSFDYNGNGTLPFFGNTKDLQVYTKALSDAELIKLTT